MSKKCRSTNEICKSLKLKFYKQQLFITFYTKKLVERLAFLGAFGIMQTCSTYCRRSVSPCLRI